MNTPKNYCFDSIDSNLNVFLLYITSTGNATSQTKNSQNANIVLKNKYNSPPEVARA